MQYIAIKFYLLIILIFLHWYANFKRKMLNNEVCALVIPAICLTNWRTSFNILIMSWSQKLYICFILSISSQRTLLHALHTFCRDSTMIHISSNHFWGKVLINERMASLLWNLLPSKWFFSLEKYLKLSWVKSGKMGDGQPAETPKHPFLAGLCSQYELRHNFDATLNFLFHLSTLVSFLWHLTSHVLNLRIKADINRISFGYHMDEQHSTPVYKHYAHHFAYRFYSFGWFWYPTYCRLPSTCFIS